MDHARKIGKKKLTTIWNIKNDPPPLATDVHPKSPDYIEDKRLKNWKKWLEIDKKTKKHLQLLTKRKNEELVINSYENYRKKIEKQCLIETASSPLNLEKSKSNIDFWKIPEYFKNNDNSSTEIGATIVKKKSLATIDIPDLIKIEKSINNLNYKKTNNYYEKRKNDLIKNIKTLQLKEPEINNLIIKGTSINNINKKTKYLKIPIITISTAEEFENNLSNIKNLDENNALILKIFDKEIIFDENSLLKNNEKSLTFNLTFISNFTNKIEQKIYLENKGIFSIKYQLHKSLEKSKQISPLTKSMDCFFIKKYSDIILPGQIVYIPVLFNAKSPGAYIEYWTFNTDPLISHYPIEFKFWGYLNGLKDKNYNKNNSRSIDEYLNLQIRDKNIHDIIEILINNVKLISQM